MKLRIGSVILYAALSPQVMAGATIDIGAISGGQDAFKDLTEELGAALSYKALVPAEPLGTLGFDIGLEISGTKMKSQAWQDATSDAAATLYVPKLHLHKGLPFGLDVGAFYSTVPDSNIEFMGAELRYAISDGSTLMPALSVRGTYSTLTGVKDLDMTTRGLELSISKGFAMLTPYGGIGAIWTDGDPSQTSGLSRESATLTKYYLGVNLNLGLINIAAETDQTGDNTTTSAKFGWRF